MEYKKATATIILTIFIAITARSSSGIEQLQLPEHFLQKTSSTGLASIAALTEYIERYKPNLNLMIDIVDIDDLTTQRVKITATPFFIAIYNYLVPALNIQTRSDKQTSSYWLDAIELFLKNGADPNMPGKFSLPEGSPHFICSPFAISILCINLEIVELLIKHNVNIKGVQSTSIKKKKDLQRLLKEKQHCT